jgi:hypothetical protein
MEPPYSTFMKYGGLKAVLPICETTSCFQRPNTYSMDVFCMSL